VTEVTGARRQDGAKLSAADEQLPRELTERARAGGLLGKLSKMVVKGTLDDHLGYARHDPAGRDGGKARNGHRVKTALMDTSTGPTTESIFGDRSGLSERARQRCGGVRPGAARRTESRMSMPYAA
jgi:putative transposase